MHSAICVTDILNSTSGCCLLLENGSELHCDCIIQNRNTLHNSAGLDEASRLYGKYQLTLEHSAAPTQACSKNRMHKKWKQFIGKLIAVSLFSVTRLIESFSSNHRAIFL